MADYNRVIMIGNLTRDPDYKTLASGQAVCRLGLASNRQFRNKQTGTMVQEVCFVDIDVWGAQAESCRQYLQKGRAVLVEGRLKFDTWEDPNGQTRSKHIIVADRVVFLSQPSIEDSENTSVSHGVEQSETNQKLEKELLDQIEEIKTRTAAKNEKKKVRQEEVADEVKVRAAYKERSTTSEEGSSSELGGVEFQDEPPFQDDLPF